MDKNQILRILEDWNFWKKDLDSGFTRLSYLRQIQNLGGSKQVMVITGAGRSGKSYIMRQFAKQLISQGVNERNILFVNFENSCFYGLDTELLAKKGFYASLYYSQFDSHRFLSTD